MTQLQTSAIADRELVATRLFRAPRDLVFKVWTDPAHLAQWWGPRGFTTTTHAMQATAGGVWRFCMHGPDGTDYENQITYLEVVAPERIVYKHGGGSDTEPVNFQVTVTFEEADDHTRLQMRMLFPSAVALQHVVEKYGADKGLEQTMDRLVERAEALADPAESRLTVTLPSDVEIMLKRAFNAPRRLVYEVVSNPQHIARWWGCEGSTVDVEEHDLRPGGGWRFVLRMPGGMVCPFKGVFQEIVPNERLVQTFIYDVDFIRDHPSVETMTLTEHEGKTTLRVIVRHDSKESRDAHLNSGMESGASQSYDRLAALIESLA